MRLSEAILAGSTLIPWGSGAQFCDCALGMGVAAVGKHDGIFDVTNTELEIAEKEWPWITQIYSDPLNGAEWRFIEAISFRYFDVHWRNLTLEQLCDWVRSVEPAEEAPRCAEPAETCTDAVSKWVA